jgi:hypothetical protein
VRAVLNVLRREEFFVDPKKANMFIGEVDSLEDQDSLMALPEWEDLDMKLGLASAFAGALFRGVLPQVDWLFFCNSHRGSG